MASQHKFGPRSEACLATVEPRLALLVRRALKVAPFDLSVTCGHRTKAEQERAVREGRSKVHFPHGHHNRMPSTAVDVHPYPVDFHDVRRYYLLAGVLLSLAHMRGIHLRWGGDWDGDGDFRDQSFNDLPHFELARVYEAGGAG